MAFIDLTGHIYNRLTIIKYLGQNKFGKSIWLCKCICGKEIISPSTPLRNGHTKSCGCYGKDKVWLVSHRMTKTPLYRVWEGIKARCLNTKDTGYKDYGGRGITVCSEWRDFNNFLKWATEYKTGLTIERIDVNGNYEPGNCIWITNADQQWNKRSTVKIIINGETLNIKQVAYKYNLSEMLVRQRAKKGWPVEEIISPVKKKRTPWKKNLNKNLQEK